MVSTRNSVADPFVHRALLYRGDAEYLAGVVPFIAAGIAAGEPVMVAVPTAQLALLTAELGAAAAQVRMLDMTKVGHNPGRIIAGVLLAFADAHDSAVRIVGEPIWPTRSTAEYQACVRHEALINHALTGRQATALCPYDADGLDATALADSATTHPELIDGTGTRRSDRFAPESALATYNLPLAPPADADTYIVDTPNMAGLRRTAAKFAALHELDEARTDDLVLVLTELASNSIEHARDSARVLFANVGGRLVCQVSDSGHITDPLAGRRPATPDQLRGRGLLLVNELADLVRVHSGPDGTTVEVQFAVEHQPGTSRSR